MRHFKFIILTFAWIFQANISVGQTSIKSIYQQGRKAVELIRKRV
jgi:hypothetical protein